MAENKELHLVLGGSGVIGQAVIKELKRKRLQVKALERTKKVEGIETINVDLNDKESTIEAISGASHVYLCIGLPYKIKIWKAEWPIVMKNVIYACSLANAKLIFLDNIYMYGPAPLSVPFDETENQYPNTKKGKLRKQIANMLLNAHKAKKIQAVIGRAADFYGPNTKNSILYYSFLERMRNNKAPQLIAKSNVKHTFAYTEDVGKALVILALDESTYGQTWHLPVGEAKTMKEILDIFNEHQGTDYKPSHLPRPMLVLLSFFMGPLREVKEMLYQFDKPYIMATKKFKEHFQSFKVTPYEQGIKNMIDSFKTK